MVPSGKRTRRPFEAFLICFADVSVFGCGVTIVLYLAIGSSTLLVVGVITKFNIKNAERYGTRMPNKIPQESRLKCHKNTEQLNLLQIKTLSYYSIRLIIVKQYGWQSSSNTINNRRAVEANCEWCCVRISPRLFEKDRCMHEADNNWY